MSNNYISLDENNIIIGTLRTNAPPSNIANNPMLINVDDIPNYKKAKNILGKSFDRANNKIMINNSSDLKALKAELVEKVDNLAEEARQRYLTSTKTQQTIYDFKLAEAEAYRAAGYPKDVSNYPLVSNQAIEEGSDTKTIVDTILSTKKQWLILAGKIEGIRIKGKRNILSATTTKKVEGLMKITSAALAAI